MSEHTKTPWVLFDAGDFIYINEKDGPGFICAVNVVSHHAEKCRANARHIVHCVNNHERLVEALRKMVSVEDCSRDAPGILFDAAEEARALLAALEAEKGGVSCE